MSGDGLIWGEESTEEGVDERVDDVVDDDDVDVDACEKEGEDEVGEEGTIGVSFAPCIADIASLGRAGMIALDDDDGDDDDDDDDSSSSPYIFFQ